MATIAELMVRIGADNKELTKKLNASKRQIKTLFGQEGMKASKLAAKSIGGLAVALAALGAASVRAAAQMEQTRKAFTTLLKDAKLSKVYLDALAKFAANTPFSLPGVLDASKRLLAFGFTAQQTIPILTSLGDAAAGLGIGEEGIQRLTLAIGQMQAKGKVSAEEMLQLAEAGIPTWDMLAERLGVTIPEAMKMGERGMIDSATGIQAVVSGMAKKFGGMMKEQSQTVLGMLSNIADSTGQIMTVIGDKITNAFDIKGKLKVLMDAIGDFADKVKSLGLGEALKQSIPPEVGMVIAGIASLIVAAAIPALINLGYAAATAAVGFATATGPIGIAIAAIGAAMYWLWVRWDWVKAQFDYLCTAVSETFTIMGNEIKFSFADMVGTAADKLNVLFALVGTTSDLADQAKEWADNTQAAAKATIEAAKANKEAARIKWEKESFRYSSKNAPTADTGSSFVSNDVDDLKLKASNLTPTGIGTNITVKTKENIGEKLAKLERETTGLGKAWTDLQSEVAYAGMTAGEQAIEDIKRERAERINTLDEVLKKQESAAKEAKAIRDEALETGTAEELEAAEKLYKDKNTLYQNSKNQEKELRLAVLAQEAEDIANQASWVNQIWTDVGTDMASGFGDAIYSMLDGTKTIKEALGDFARSVIKNALKMAAEFAGLCSILALFGVIPPGPIAAKMMFGIDPKHQYAAGSRGAKLAAGHASGGYISGAGTGTSDSIPAMLSKGEYVVNAASVNRLGLPFLNSLNYGNSPDYGAVNYGRADGTKTSAGVVKQPKVINLSISAMDASSFEDFLSRGGLDRIKQALLDDGRGFRTEAGTW